VSATRSPFDLREHPPTLPSGRTFLLVHGYGASSFSWRSLVPALTARGTVLTVDLVGYGDEAYPDERCAPSVLAERLDEALRERSTGELTLVGHSLGGGIALRLAQRLQDEGRPASRMIIVGGAAYHQELPPFVFLANQGRPAEAAFRLVSPELLASQVLRTIVYDAGCITREMVEGYARPLADPSVQRALLAAARVIVPPDLDRMVARYPQLDAPTLLVWGRQDRVVPLWVGRRLAADLPHARLVVIERCGHAPMEEHPHRFRVEIEAFLDETDPPTA